MFGEIFIPLQCLRQRTVRRLLGRKHIDRDVLRQIFHIILCGIRQTVQLCGSCIYRRPGGWHLLYHHVDCNRNRKSHHNHRHGKHSCGQFFRRHAPASLLHTLAGQKQTQCRHTDKIHNARQIQTAAHKTLKRCVQIICAQYLRDQMVADQSRDAVHHISQKKECKRHDRCNYLTLRQRRCQHTDCDAGTSVQPEAQNRHIVFSHRHRAKGSQDKWRYRNHRHGNGKNAHHG